jgi:Haem-binding domain
MGRVWKVVLVVVAVLVVIQLIPVDRSNPDFDNKNTIYSKETVPRSIKAVLDRSCADCHSDHTTWPSYAYVAPISWLVVHDVHDGRKHLNFSEWGNYSPKQREEALENVCEQVQQGQMPQKIYTWLHPDARLKPSERDAICQWTEAARKY